MTENNHPITPPPELVEQWARQWKRPTNGPSDLYQYIATQAARWGADQELEACCEYLENESESGFWSEILRIARRPKPPTLKKQALIELGDVYNRNKIDDVTYDTIRLALEQLND